MKRFLLAILLLVALSTDAKKYKYDVAVCAIFRNEAHYLKEWIEYHRLIGVECFYLYNHLSTDNYKAVLQPYLKQGIVKLVEWNRPATDLQSWNKIQCDAYTNCIKECKDKVNWLAVIDIDEFIVLTYQNSLKEFLAAYSNVGSVAIHWQMFGTSGVKQIPANKLLIETLTRKAVPDHSENITVKNIVRPSRVKLMDNPHYAQFNGPWFQVNTRMERFAGASNHTFDIEQIRINHYWSRDEDYFYNHKRSRREGWAEAFENQVARVNSLNEVEDTTILRFVPQLREKMGLK